MGRPPPPRRPRSSQGSPPSPEPLLDVPSLASFLGVSPKTVYRWQEHSEGPPAIRLGGRLLRWRREDVDAWLEERRDGA